MADNTLNKKRNRSAVSPQIVTINKRKMPETKMDDVTPHPPEKPDSTLDSLRSQLADMSENINLDDSQKQVVKAVYILLQDSVETNMKKIGDRLDQEIKQHSETKEELAYTQLELDSLKLKHDELSRKYTQVLNRVVEAEMKSMENNIIISGIPELPGETEDNLRHWINTLVADLGAVEPPNISEIHRLKPKGRGKPRDVIVRFARYSIKREFFGQRYKIREIKNGHYKSIWLSEQYPPEIQEERKVLLAVAAEARQQFPDIARNISVFKNTLYIDRTRYKVSTLHLLPDSLQPIVQGFKQNDEAVAFFTKRSPLSNHYPCQFSYDGENYLNGEQFFMMEKAKCFDDDAAYHQLSKMENPAAMKGVGRNIKGFDASTWHKQSMTVLVPGLLQKFEQNKVCREALMNTGNRKLGEATKEDPWGIGMNLADPNVLNTSLWKDKPNIMGKVLEKIRETLREKAKQNDPGTSFSS